MEKYASDRRLEQWSKDQEAERRWLNIRRERKSGQAASAAVEHITPVPD